MSARRIITLSVVGRGSGDISDDLTGAAGMAFLESLRSDTAAFAGIDASLPMRREHVKVVRFDEAQEDDF